MTKKRKRIAPRHGTIPRCLPPKAVELVEVKNVEVVTLETATQRDLNEEATGNKSTNQKKI